MKPVTLYTKSKRLTDEFRSALPDSVKYTDKSTAPKGVLVFFDIDSERPSEIQELSLNSLVVGITAKLETAPVMEAISFGAYEVIHRPLKAKDMARLLDEVSALSVEIDNILDLGEFHPTPTCAIVGNSSVIMDVCKKIAKLSQVDVPVLITGETGTGKELIAEAISQFSLRFGKPFVVINCAAMPETLLESELFGFEKGSFTGADSSKEGLFKIADGGTVFLDEVGELPLPIQSKLLRFLQTQSFYPIGGLREVQVDVRVISATNRDIRKMIKGGKFREDLYHRLNVAEVYAPPLRGRKKDIAPLMQFFMEKYRHTSQLKIRGVTKGFINKLADYDWPGNIRELENIIRSSIAMSKTGYLTTHELRSLDFQKPRPEKRVLGVELAEAINPYLREAIREKEPNLYEKLHAELDKHLIEYILGYTKENKSEAARALGINRLTLRKKISQR
jgi:two-component system nitrogen regulation response regulator GlnG